MQFQSRIIRNIFVSMFIGSLPDILFSLIAAWYINEGYIWAVAIYFGLQALYFAVWAVRSIFSWGLFFLFGRKKLAAQLVDFLFLNKFPSPNEFEDSAKSYLTGVSDNPKLDIQVRLVAAHELGALTMIDNLHQTQYGLKITFAFEDAIAEYKRLLIRNQK